MNELLAYSAASESGPPIPATLRILVVDDRVGANDPEGLALQETISNILSYWAYTAYSSLEHVDVVYAKDAFGEGWSRWRESFWDLVLVDAEFQRDLKDLKNRDVVGPLKEHFRSEGVALYKQIKASMEKGGPFHARQGVCEVSLWSSHDALKGRALIGFVSKRLRPGEKGGVRNKVEAAALRAVRGRSPLHQVEHSLLPQVQHILWQGRDRERTPCLPRRAQYDGFLALSGDERPRLFTRPPVNEGNKWHPVKHFIAENWQDPQTEDVSESTSDGDWKPNAAPMVKEPMRFLDCDFPSPVFAAATPLTGTTVAGALAAVRHLEDKVLALLGNAGFGGVVLKTTYLDSLNQWASQNWPELHIQSGMRTRCLRIERSYWNAGKTATEMLPPTLLKTVLKNLRERVRANDQGLLGERGSRVIVSLGSKYPEKPDRLRYRRVDLRVLREIWEMLFHDVFGEGKEGVGDGWFPLVEINVRHYLRESLEFHAGGDEYLNPVSVAGAAEGNRSVVGLADVLEEFWSWMCVLHETGVKYRKKLILKLPYRTDILRFVRAVHDFRKQAVRKEDNGFGVCALSLINTVKCPAPPAKRWADPLWWGDSLAKAIRYQMSGAGLSPYRDQLLGALLSSLPDDWDLQLLVGGGVRTRDDVKGCLGLQERLEAAGGKKAVGRAVLGVQVGTAALESQAEKREPGDVLRLKSALGSVRGATSGGDDRDVGPRLIQFIPWLCIRCRECRQSYYCDAFLRRSMVAKNPLDSGEPRLESRNCSGCGLCVQVCPTGALRLRRPSETIAVVSEFSEMRRILERNGIPHVWFEASESMPVGPEGDAGAAAGHSGPALGEPQPDSRLNRLAATWNRRLQGEAKIVFKDAAILVLGDDEEQLPAAEAYWQGRPFEPSIDLSSSMQEVFGGKGEWNPAAERQLIAGLARAFSVVSPLVRALDPEWY